MRTTERSLDWIDALELGEHDSDLIRQTRERHAQQDAVNIDAWLTEVATAQEAEKAEKKGKGNRGIQS